MSEVRDKLFAYSQKWAGLANILHGDCVPLCMDKYTTHFAENKPCGNIIDEEAMAYTINCMKVFEYWAGKVHDKIIEDDKTKITLADAIRTLNSYYPINNKTQFAQSRGITRELLYKYLPKYKDSSSQRLTTAKPKQ